MGSAAAATAVCEEDTVERVVRPVVVDGVEAVETVLGESATSFCNSGKICKIQSRLQ